VSSRERWRLLWPLGAVLAVILMLAAVVTVFVLAVNGLDENASFKPTTTKAIILLIGVLCLASVIAALVLLFRNFVPSSGQAGSTAGTGERAWPFWPLIIVVAVILVLASVATVLVVAVNSLDDVKSFRPEITTATVLIIGVIGLLSVIAVLVVVFRHYDPEGATGALGLPDGSVQAVIALALILIFALFGVYLHGQARSEIRRSSCLTQGQLEVIPDGTVTRVRPKRWKRGSACTSPAPKAKVTKARRNTARARRAARQATRRSARRAARNTVVRYDVSVAVANPERQNITTQLLSVIGTLLVAVAGFYFGSKAVQAGVKRGGLAAAGGAAIARDRHPDDQGEGGMASGRGRPRRGGGGGAGDEGDVDDEAVVEDEAEGEEERLYGSHSAAGLSHADVREELQSAPLAEEDEADESLREQGTEEPEDAEPEEADVDELGEEPDEGEVEEPGGEEAEAEDESVYGTTSPVLPGLTATDVHEELDSAPLAEEDEAEESLREQGVDEPAEVEDTETEEEPAPEPAPEDEEPPEKV
jgi:hypothetical protein